MKVVVIGGSFGGIQAALDVKRLDPKAEVLLIEKQMELGFIPSSLAMILKKEVSSINEACWITKKEVESYGIKVKTGIACTGLIDEQTIRLSTGESVVFDRLILAAGSRQSYQQKEKKSTRIKSCRTTEDVIEILTMLKSSQIVAIVGGGSVGLDLADALESSAQTIHLFESDTQLSGRYFDTSMVRPVEEAISQSSIILHKETFVETMKEEDNSVRLFFEDTYLDVDLVLLANSTRPDNQIWEPLACNEDGTIRVDSYLRTSFPNIYAIGDMIQVDFRLTGERMYVSLVSNALRTARIVSQNIVGTKKEDPGTVRACGNCWFGQYMGSVGLMEKEQFFYPKAIKKKIIELSLKPAIKETAKIQLLWEEETGILLGAQIASKKDCLYLLDRFTSAIQHQETIDAFLLDDYFFHPLFRTPGTLYRTLGAFNDED